jgi:hypothetical protein
MLETYLIVGVCLVLGVLAALVLIVAMQPASFRIERSASMAAPASAVFAQVNDFHNWDGWSPWAKIDPNMKQTYEGAPSGTGAIYYWIGDKNVGEGRMTMVDSKPNEQIRIKLEFMKPFKATNEAQFAFKANGSQTSVTWSMTGQRSFMFKAVGLFMSMDKMLGGQFEKGLTSMKSIVEGGKK